MKKLFMLMAFAALMLTSCKEPLPTVQFSSAVGVLLPDAPLTVDMTLSGRSTAKDAASTVSVPVSFAGSAVLGEDYEVSAREFVFSGNTTKASIQITPKNNFENGKEIVIGIGSVPAGYLPGSQTSMVIAVDPKEKIIYSFAAEKADLLDTYQIKLNLTGVNTGKSFSATEDMIIPFTFTSASTAVEGKEFEVVGGKKELVVAKGENTAVATIKILDVEFGQEKSLVVAVDKEKLSGRFVEGDVATLNVSVKGFLQYSALVGDWTCTGFMGNDSDVIDEWSLWLMEMEDDPEECPVNAEGYKIKFAFDDKGNLVLTPGSVKGDLDWLLRTSKVSYCAPVNPTLGSEVAGPYCTIEPIMWTMEYISLTYFELDNANRAISPSKEKLGKVAVAIRFNDAGNLEIHLRDYDEPDFMPNWWGGDFDPDMYGFWYEFTKD